MSLASADTFNLVSENFNTLGNSTTPPAGWKVGYTGLQQQTTANGTLSWENPNLIVDNGTVDVNALDSNGRSFNYGATGGADRSLGNDPRTGGGTGDRDVQLAVTNTLATPITSLSLSYAGEQWRSNGTAAQVITVWFSTSETTGYVSMGSGLTFTSPINSAAVGALDGDAAANRAVKSADFTPSSPIAPGATFYIRWLDINDSGVLDHGMSVDDVVLTGQATPEPATMSLLVLGGLALLRRRARNQ